jgi:diguanylate cyclase (GGDEF)-like protein/PAS domain S-box-containing protein
VDKNIKILIIEKSKSKASALINGIKRKGYEPEYKIVGSSKSAARSVSKEKWDVILTDYKLSDDSLADTIEIVKKSNPDIPFIVISDSVGEENAVSFIKKGADNYITRNNLSNLIPLIKEEIQNAKQKMKKEEALRKLKEKERYFKSLIENIPDIVFRYRLIPKQGYEYISPSVKRNLGYTPEQFYDDPKFIYKIIHMEDRNIFKKVLDGSFKYSKPVEIRYTHKNGRAIWYEGLITPFFSQKGKLVAIEGIMRDISGRKKTEERLSYMSFHDRLTDLYNRAYFEEELKRLDTRRQLPLSVIIGDVNGLKLINDAFGHKEGDKILKGCAEVLKKCCRTEDIVARWGGDEFSILLPKTDEDVLSEIIKRVKHKSTKTKKSKIPLSISLGMSTKNKNYQDFSKVIKKAEDNMYRHKLIDSKSIISSIISSLEKILFEKSVKTERHTEKVKEMSLKLAKSIKLSKIKIEELSLLAAIYDIGKVAILDIILNKKENLSKREWETIKRHPEIGYRIALASHQLSSIAEYILTSHEWWDGSGYPQGLKGEEIPILSRVITVVDAYEAMVTGRPYKKAISKNAAIKELEKCSGTQFEPRLVDRFIKILKRNKKY